MFDPSPAGWDEIGAPYHRQFSDDERVRISNIVNRYLDERRFEHAAALQSDKIDIIDKMLQAARQTNGVLNRLNRRDAPNRNAQLDAVLGIEQAWPGGGGAKNLRNLIILSHGLALACLKAKENAEGESGIRIGMAWDQMIKELSSLLKELGLKISVNKGQRAKEVFKPSAFVSFVKALETQYPSDIPRRSNTDFGLSDAISGVLRARKRGTKNLLAPKIMPA